MNFDISFVKDSKILFWLIIIFGLLLGSGETISQTTVSIEDEPLIINEFSAASSGQGLVDEDGDHADWIEIHNRSQTSINLAGWSLTDDSNDPQKWPFPDLSLGSGQYLVVFASGKDRRVTGTDSPLHANFRLNKAGEFLSLYNVLEERWVGGRLSPYPPQQGDNTYGWNAPEAAYTYFRTPTPGQPNAAEKFWLGLVSEVQFSQSRGFYDTPFLLTLTSDTLDAAIRYTLDGTVPTEDNGLLYTKPITVETTTAIRAAGFKPGYLPASPVTHSYIFLDEVLRQPAAPAGFPPTWGVHRQDIWDFRAGSPVQADYQMDPQVVNHPDYRQSIKQDLQAIPTLSLVTGIEAFSDLYANPLERGRVWERPVSVEFFDPTTDQPGFQIDAGVRIHGARGREPYILKHSFRLFFRKAYGAARLEYPLFPDSPVESFDTLILRGGVNRSYAGQLRSEKSGFELATYTRDEWLRTSQREMSGFGAHGIFVHLYINGLYWGLYNLVERPDAVFAASYFGGEEADWYAMNAGGPINNSIETFDQLQRKLYAINDLAPARRYPAIKAMIDTKHFADYIILNWYAGTRDWPHNNWYAAIELPDGQIRFFVWDGEVTWQAGARFSLGDGNNYVKQFFDTLIQYPDFKIEFADRIYHHLFNDGALSSDGAITRWEHLNLEINRAIVGESARWGDARYAQPITRADWLAATADVEAQMAQNVDKFIALAREAGYYPPLDPPRFNRAGGLVTPDFELTLTPTDPAAINEATKIYYTTNGTDPRTPGTGTLAAAAQRYDKPVNINQTARIKARTKAGETWSALAEATFRVVAADPKIRISEIMYNPPDGADYEFIELQNSGNAFVDLSQSYFEGINFTFPIDTRLAPGERLVLVRNPNAFASRYPSVSWAGIYSGKLANSGEEIALRQPDGQLITGVAYRDGHGWPLSADGRGDSLELINPDGEPDDPKNWRASLQLHGTPGTTNQAQP